jgi:hypothetical protein
MPIIKLLNARFARPSTIRFGSDSSEPAVKKSSVVFVFERKQDHEKQRYRLIQEVPGLPSKFSTASKNKGNGCHKVP